MQTIREKWKNNNVDAKAQAIELDQLSDATSQFEKRRAIDQPGQAVIFR